MSGVARGGWAESSVPVGRLVAEGKSGRNELLRGPIHPAESFVPTKAFREKEILPTSSGGAGENDIRKDVRPRDDSS